MCQWTGSALVLVMACHLFGAKPLTEPVLTNYQSIHQELISIKFESKLAFNEEIHLKNVVYKMSAVCGGEEWVKVKLVTHIEIGGVAITSHLKNTIHAVWASLHFGWLSLYSSWTIQGAGGSVPSNLAFIVHVALLVVMLDIYFTHNYTHSCYGKENYHGG